MHSLRNVPGTEFSLSLVPDSLCAHCPHHTADDLCGEARKDLALTEDGQILWFCTRASYVYQDLIRAIDAQMTQAMLEDICRGCAWYPSAPAKRISAEVK